MGGSAAIAELESAVIEREKYSPKVQEVLHTGGPSTEVQYRLAWARTYLKGMGLLTNSQRGVWSVTELGRQVKESDIKPLHTEYVASTRMNRATKKRGAKSDVSGEIDQVETEAEADWKDNLLHTLVSMSPAAFERLAQRLLRESGFSSVAVTGRSGDGGIGWTRCLPDLALEFSGLLPVQAFTPAVSAHQR